MEKQSPIAIRIPPEVLMKIFWEHVEILRADEYHWRGNPYLWIYVTHVCKYWRSAALGFGQIWANVVIHNPEWTRVCLRRSHQAPLRVVQTFNRLPHILARRLESLLIVLQELPRIRSIELELPLSAYSVLSPIKDVVLRRDLLEMVKLEICDSSADATDLLNLFIHDAPNLQSLETRCHTRAWTTKFPNTLKHLTINLAAYDSGIGLVLDALENTPLLESLSAVNLPPVPYGTSSAALAAVDRVITLPRLRFMNLDDDAINCAGFLYYLSIPASATLSIISQPVDIRHDPSNLARSISSWLNNPCPPGPAQPIQSVAVNLSEHHIWRMFTLYGWRSVLPMTDLNELDYLEEPPIPPDLTVKFQVPMDLVRHEDIALVGFCSNLTMSNAQVVYIGSMFLKDSQSSLSRAFSSMGELHTLGITARAGRVLPSLLQGDPPLFPALHTLHLMNVRMVEPKATPAHFIHAMWLRRDKGSGVRKLVISDCIGVKSTDVDRFKDVVDEVEWDEFEASDDGDDTDDGDEEDENGEEGGSED